MVEILLYVVIYHTLGISKASTPQLLLLLAVVQLVQVEELEVSMCQLIVWGKRGALIPVQTGIAR